MCTCTTGFAIFLVTTGNRFREESREGGLADSAGTREEIRMSRLPFGDARLEDADGRVLTDDIGEKLWAIFTGEGHRGKRLDVRVSRVLR